MEITYMVIIAVVTLVAGAITKTFIEEIPTRFIPVQNLVIGIISAIICIVFDVETNVLQAFVLCILSSFGAGGAYDLATLKIKGE